MESLLTGVLYIDIGFHPDRPANLYLAPGSGPYPEIPTIPTQLEQIQKEATEALEKIGQVDFKKLGESITEAGQAVDRLASDPHLASRRVQWICSWRWRKPARL